MVYPTNLDQYLFYHPFTKFLELNNDDTEDEQLLMTELKDNNEVDDKNWEQYNLNFIIWSLTRFLYIFIYIMIYSLL